MKDSKKEFILMKDNNLDNNNKNNILMNKRYLNSNSLKSQLNKTNNKQLLLSNHLKDNSVTLEVISLLIKTLIKKKRKS